MAAVSAQGGAEQWFDISGGANTARGGYSDP